MTLHLLYTETVYLKKNMVYGIDYNLPYLIGKSVVRYPPPTTRERDGVGKISSNGWAHLYLSAYFQINQQGKGEYIVRGGKG